MYFLISADKKLMVHALMLLLTICQQLLWFGTLVGCVGCVIATAPVSDEEQKRAFMRSMSWPSDDAGLTSANGA